MVKFPEAEARLFKNMFVCRKCKSKMRAPSLKVSAGKVKCRKCDSSALRTIKKK
ncbi:MAG: 50S ribosomal protein L40e [Nanoarchaeota archaeon]|nr:50S ribosomal protein L40e [Nanoarchaeota archaeon]MBU1269576.1 50S ribosomal protein L40e [Nanoarchaeota archaeon]MBU1604692.1 50S ribosomal protein L40e [Nanoarchaeota archaeon]MBU2443837.1 50S ribosomal protein L40e [Nanoarchaeota archaeon]